MENNVDKAYSRGRQRDVLAYFWENSDKIIHISALEKVFRNKYSRNQIMATMAHVCREDIKAKYNLPIERHSQGVWRLNKETKAGDVHLTEKVAATPNGYQQLTVTIIKEADEEMVVVDDNTNIYRMVKVNL